VPVQEGGIQMKWPGRVKRRRTPIHLTPRGSHNAVLIAITAVIGLIAYPLVEPAGVMIK
jgi:hypothetical protein